MQILPLRVRRVRCRPNSQLKDWFVNILIISEASDQKNFNNFIFSGTMRRHICDNLPPRCLSHYPRIRLVGDLYPKIATVQRIENL